MGEKIQGARNSEASTLIGKRVKRNVYGESVWADKVIEVFYVMSGNFSKRRFKAVPWIRVSSGHAFLLSEVIFLD